MAKDAHQSRLQQILAKDNRFPLEAYLFIEEVVSRAARELRRKGEPGAAKHISGQELLMVARRLLLQKYGPLASDVLETWNVARCEDFGDIVFNLVAVGLLGVSPTDSRDDFVGVFDFTTAFIEPFVARGPMPQLPLLDLD
jgi:uncharacterized repeat protein (TIGR04138 family)